MKKIKILAVLLSLLLILYIFHFMTTSYLIITGIFDEFETFHPVSNLGFSLITFLGLLYVVLALILMIKNSYFNKKSKKYLKIGGIILLFDGLFSLCFTIFVLGSMETIDILITSVMLDALLFISGYSIYTIADILKAGLKIKTENDLTI